MITIKPAPKQATPAWILAIPAARDTRQAETRRLNEQSDRTAAEFAGILRDLSAAL